MPFWKRIKKCKRGEAPLAFSCLRFLFQAHLRRYSSYPFGSVGKGLERETLCPFPRLRRFGTHYETGSKFLLLFSIKSKGESPCFAEKVLNWRNTHVVQETPLRDCAQSVRSTAPFGVFLIMPLQISPEHINIPRHSCQMYP